MQKIFILLGVLFITCSAHAQTVDGSRIRGQHIQYTIEQRKQIRDLAMDYRKRSADLFNNDDQTLGQYKAALIALQKEKQAKMQALLTTEQKDRLAKRRERAHENREVRAAARMERLKIRLDLTDQQVATLRTKQEALGVQLKAIHENDDLLPQQKMEQFKALAGKRKEMIRSVLTPDQLTKFNGMETAHDGRRFGRRGMRDDDRPMRADD